MDSTPAQAQPDPPLPASSSPSQQLQPQQHDVVPPWHDSALPFLVLVRDSTPGQSTSPTPTPSPTPQAPKHRQSWRQRQSSDPQPQTSTSITSTAASAKKYKLAYPEIRYVFADDDFSPAIDVLDSCNSDGPGETGVVVDFDASGVNVIQAQSLSTGWQVHGVERLAQDRGTSASGHVWAAGAEPVANVVYIDGAAAPATDVQARVGQNAAQGGEKNVEELVKRFNEVSEQMRRVLEMGPK